MAGSRQMQPRHDSRTSNTHGSATQTSTGAPAGLSTHGTLHLRGEEQPPQEPQRRIRWAEDVVNNEGMGKKKSKVCCIYHKPRAVGESSDESSDSSSDSDSEGDNDDGSARLSNHRTRDNNHGPCDHAHGAHNHSNSRRKSRKPSPNAYEKQPKHTTKSGS